MRSQIEQAHLHWGEGAASWRSQPGLVQFGGDRPPRLPSREALMDEVEHALSFELRRKNRGQPFDIGDTSTKLANGLLS